MTAYPLMLLSTPEYPSASRALTLSIAYTGSVSGSLNTSDSAALTWGAAGEVWIPHLLCAKVGERVRQWIFNAIAGDAALSNSGTVSDIGLTLAYSFAEGAGASRWVLTISDLNTVEGVTISSVTLDNTSGAWTPLGLCEEGTTRTVSAVGGVVTITGDWQPRTTWVYPHHVRDTGDQRTRYLATAEPLTSGDVAYFDAGGHFARRTLTLADQAAEYVGPGYVVARWSSFGATRKTINVRTADETVLSGFGEYLFQDSLATVGRYIVLGSSREARRIKSVTTTTITTWEPFPASLSLTAGDEVRVVSECEAMRYEATRGVGYLVVHGVDDLTGAPIVGQYTPYALTGAEEPEERQQADPYYSAALDLLRRYRSTITLP